MRLRKPTGTQLFGAFLIYIGVAILVGAGTALEGWAKSSMGLSTDDLLGFYVLAFMGCAIVPIAAGLIIYYGVLVVRGEADF